MSFTSLSIVVDATYARERYVDFAIQSVLLPLGIQGVVGRTTRATFEQGMPISTFVNKAEVAGMDRALGERTLEHPLLYICAGNTPITLHEATWSVDYELILAYLKEKLIGVVLCIPPTKNPFVMRFKEIAKRARVTKAKVTGEEARVAKELLAIGSHIGASLRTTKEDWLRRELQSKMK